MRARTGVVLVVLATVVFVPGLVLAQAPPFSADMVVKMGGKQAEEMQKYLENLRKQGTKVPEGLGGAGATYRVYVSGLKMRMDMGTAERKTSMLSDMNPGAKSYTGSHADRSYLEFQPDQKDAKKRNQAADLARFMRSGGDLCAARTGEAAEGTCKKLGSKVIGGRSCDEYELVSEGGRKQTLCMDARLHFPLRMGTESGSSELQNIAEGPQPDSVFALPPGYTKKEVGSPGK